MLLRLRRTAAAASGPHAAGRSLDITLALADSDPTATASELPITRWAKEAWNALNGDKYALSVDTLTKLWARTRPDLVTKWNSARGPMAAACLSAKRLGWTIKGRFKL